MTRIEERYADFGPTLAAEYLCAEGFTVSKQALRGWMIEAGVWQAKHKRPPGCIHRGRAARGWASWYRSTAVHTTGSKDVPHAVA